MKPKQNSPICEHCGFNENTQNEPHQLPHGAVLRGQYLVGKCLGQGGFGITYLGWDLHLDIPIAIKEYYPNYIVANRDTRQSFALTGVAANMTDLYVSTRQRFLREARVLARLSTIPNIVRIHNFFEENNTAYIVMEYVKGIDLRQYMNMQGGRLTIQQTLTVLKPLMEAIHQVHQAGIVHRDISPDNIMLMADGTPKLLDFGAVRNMESSNAEQELQHSTEAILKHGFAPMEQYQKRGALGPWTDEYALCATIYYCLTGRVPPDAPQRMTEDIHPEWDKIPGLEPQQIRVLEKGMAPRGKDRYGSIAELMTALYGAPPVPSVPAPQPAPAVPAQKSAPEAEAPACTIRLSSDPIPAVKKKKGKGKRILAAVLGIAIVAAVAAAVLTGNRPEKQMEAPSDPNASQSVTVPSATTMPSETPEVPAEPSLPTATTETTEAPTEPTEPPVWIDNVLMDNGNGEPYSPAFGTWITRNSIRSVTFLDTLKDAPEVNIWDVSEAQDGSVMAWVYQNGNKYDMYIAGEGGINAKYCSMMFLNFTALETVAFGTAFHTDQAESFFLMFDSCSALKELDLTGFNTANVTSTSNMFNGCKALTSVDLCGWNTSNVIEMGYMFYFCESLTNLEITGWDLSSLTGYEGFMADAQTINGKPWEEFFMYRPVKFDDDSSYANAPWVNNILMVQQLSYGNYWESIGQTTPAFGTPLERGSIRSITFLDTLKDAPADTWDVSAAQNGSVLAWAEYDDTAGMYDMFIAGEGGVRASSCVNLFYSFTGLETVEFGTAFHIEGITSTANMFHGCASLRELDLSHFDTSSVTDMSYMFYKCESLNEPNTSGWDTSNVTDMDSMFSFCYGLTTPNLSHFDTGNVTSLYGMFEWCKNLTEVNMSGWDTSNVTSTVLMFGYCDSLDHFDFSDFETDSLTTVAFMFTGCYKLKNLEITNWDTSKVTYCPAFMDDGDTINGNPWGTFFP